MASIIKRGSVWRASVYKYGIRKTASFKTKTEAKLWASEMELKLTEAHKGGVSKEPFIEVLERYRREITPKKRSSKTENNVLNLIAKAPFMSKPISDITTKDIVAWRDSYTDISNATINIRLGLVKNIFAVAIREWQLIKSNPASAVRNLKASLPRFRRVTQDEIEAIVNHLNYSGASKLGRSGRGQIGYYSGIVSRIFQFAIETGMRLGEILNLTHENVDKNAKTAYLPMTKNGHPRTVPLSAKAINLIGDGRSEERVFNIGRHYFQKIFRLTKIELGIKDLHFHDTRHEAITRLSKKVTVLELARIVGHRNINQLLTYYNESAEGIGHHMCSRHSKETSVMIKNFEAGKIVGSNPITHTRIIGVWCNGQHSRL